MGNLKAPAGAASSFGFSVSGATAIGLLAVGAPDDEGTVTIYESTTVLSNVSCLKAEL